MNADFDVTNLVIETDRLILREWYLSDLDDFFEYASVEGVGEQAGWPHHENKEKSLEILKRFIDEKKTFAIVYKENKKVIGSLGVEKYGCEEKLTEFLSYKGREIGYVLSKDYWGKGLMTEAVEAVINYLFNALNYDFLLCGYFDFNKKSKRVQEKCGFIPYRRLTFSTRMETEEKGILSILVNKNKNIKLQYSHPETLIINERYKDKIISLLNKEVIVKVDRPLGTYHPRHHTIFYEVNYGYIDEMYAPDGDKQDAYILGVSEPVKQFNGIVIGYVERVNDNEYKLLVAPKGIIISKEEIEKQIYFQERYFEHKIHLIDLK